MTKTVTLIDYGLGNLASVQQALIHCGAEVNIAVDASSFSSKNPVILPGVGAFSDGIAALKERGLTEPLSNFAKQGGKLLGICLGMQMLFERSEEFGMHEGLGIIPGVVTQIPTATSSGQRRKIPHIGWGELKPAGRKSWTNTPLENLGSQPFVYFVHSFAAQPAEQARVLAVCDYEGFSITAVVQSMNVLGCQFHPEKSGEVGLGVLKAFFQ